jgi:hypothetical protein
MFQSPTLIRRPRAAGSNDDEAEAAPADPARSGQAGSRGAGSGQNSDSADEEEPGTAHRYEVCPHLNGALKLKEFAMEWAGAWTHAMQGLACQGLPIQAGH